MKLLSTLLGKLLSAVIILAVLGAFGMLIYTVADPPVKEKFTEFYILSIDGKADKYPHNLEVGETAEVIVGIVNREQVIATYTVELTNNGASLASLGPVTLNHEEKCEELMIFQIDNPGKEQKVEFQLYKDGQNAVYETLYLVVNALE
ncbi:MAG: DUF1616 domain-containing protein [Dehalococcoidales bacterium]|nr:DUF1616 domain-containing protein [Dehalococcoidales bacterium]